MYVLNTALAFCVRDERRQKKVWHDWGCLKYICAVELIGEQQQTTELIASPPPPHPPDYLYICISHSIHLQNMPKKKIIAVLHQA